jgi:hypothetical protein
VTDNPNEAARWEAARNRAGTVFAQWLAERDPGRAWVVESGELAEVIPLASRPRKVGGEILDEQRRAA